MASIKVLKNYFLLAVAFTMLIESCKSVQYTGKTEAQQYNLSKQYTVDSSILSFYKPYKDTLDAKMNEVLNSAEVAMEKGQPESLLGNFFADAVLIQTQRMGMQVDFAVPTSMGGLRAGINQGTITLSEVYELMPFENEVVILTLSAEQVRKVVDGIVRSGGQPCSGIRVNATKQPLEIIIGDKQFDSTKIYKVLTSDYLANGGDNFSGFLNPMARNNTKLKLRDVVIEYLKEEASQQRSINAKKDGRVILK